MKFIWFFIPLLLMSGEVFYDKNISTYSLSKKYSVADFSYKESISYIDTNQTFINKYQESYINDYKNKNPKEEVLAMLDTSTFGGDLYNDIKIDIFSKTKETITLETITSNYLGGAHGSYYIELQNFYRKIPITLKMIVKDYKKLLKIAQNHYKFIHLMAQNDSLQKDGWFENRFILPQQFAITNRGLLFFYNSYEIKPYSYGITTFMLPYYKIKDILKLKFSKKPIVFENDFGKIVVINNKKTIEFKIINYFYTSNEKVYLKIGSKIVKKSFKNLEYDSIKSIILTKPDKETIIDIQVSFDNNFMPIDGEIPIYDTKEGLVYRFSIL